MSASDIPQGDAVDNDYKSRTGQSEIPVQSDEAAVEATEYDNGGDSDKQLGMVPILFNTFSLLTSQQRRMRRMPLMRATLLTRAHVVQQSSPVLTPSPAMRRKLTT
jgi:hypothetical protein